MKTPIRSLIALLALCAPTSHAFDFENVVVGKKFNPARAAVPFSRAAPSSKSTTTEPMLERFADATFGHEECHIVVTLTAKDNVVQDILIYWSGDSQSVLDALTKKFGKPTGHVVKSRMVNGRQLTDAISTWSDGTNASTEFHAMAGDQPYISMSTKSFIERQ